MGVAALCTRAASQCVCVWVYMCVCAPSNPFYRTCPSVPAPSVNAPRFLDKALLGLCSVSSAERDGVFVLTGWQLLGGAEFVVVSRRMLSAPAPADGDRALILHPHLLTRSGVSQNKSPWPCAPWSRLKNVRVHMQLWPVHWCQPYTAYFSGTDGVRKKGALTPSVSHEGLKKKNNFRSNFALRK